MAITLIPDPGSVTKNFQIVNSGGSFDNVKDIYKQGLWISGKLDGPDCRVTNYSDSINVNIRQGAYTADKENGLVLEYVFLKSDWALFLTNPDLGVDCTRYAQTFNNGAWVSTSETIAKKIKGSQTLNSRGYTIAFTFSEV